MTLKVRVLADEFAPVMAISFGNPAGKGTKDLFISASKSAFNLKLTSKSWNSILNSRGLSIRKSFYTRKSAWVDCHPNHFPVFSNNESSNGTLY